MRNAQIITVVIAQYENEPHPVCLGTSVSGVIVVSGEVVVSGALVVILVCVVSFAYFMDRWGRQSGFDQRCYHGGHIPVSALSGGIPRDRYAYGRSGRSGGHPDLDEYMDQ